MPFKSEKQRRYLYANHPEIAKKWSRDYRDGGYVEPIVNMADGGLVYRQEGGTAANEGWTVQKINALSNEEVLEIAKKNGMKLEYRNGNKKTADQLRYEMRVPVTNAAAMSAIEALSMAIDFVPIIGDIKGGIEAGIAYLKGDYLAAGMIAGATAIGFIPGVGDAMGVVIKKASKVVGKIFKELLKGLREVGMSDASINALGKNISKSAGKAAIEVTTGGNYEEVIKRHISELTAEAERRGFTVYRSDAHQYEHFGVSHPSGKPSTYSKEAAEKLKPYINIPAGSSVGEYVTALEEFSHALDAGTRLVPGQIGTLTKEATAKLNALNNSRVPLDTATLQQVADTYSSYLAEIASLYRSGNFQAFEELVEGIPDGSHGIWDLLNDTQFIQVSKRGLLGPNADQHIKRIENHTQGVLNRGLISGPKPRIQDTGVPGDASENPLIKVGRPAQMKKFYIQNKDGSVEEFDGTLKEFRDLFGVGVSGSKKPRGRLPDGRQWSKSGEFKEFKTGTAKLDEKPLDPETLQFTEKGQRARLPKLDYDLILQLENTIDDEVVKWADIYTSRHLNAPTGDVETFAVSSRISDQAWPQIHPKILELTKDLPVDKQNKVLQWARNQSRQIFGRANFGNKAPEFSMPHTEIPSVWERIANRKETGKRWHDVDHRSVVERIMDAGVNKRNAYEIAAQYDNVSDWEKGIKRQDKADGVFKKRSSDPEDYIHSEEDTAKLWELAKYDKDLSKLLGQQPPHTLHKNSVENILKNYDANLKRKKEIKLKKQETSRRQKAIDTEITNRKKLVVEQAYDDLPKNFFEDSYPAGRVDTMYQLATGKLYPRPEIKFPSPDRTIAPDEVLERALEADRTKSLSNTWRGHKNRYRNSDDFIRDVMSDAYDDFDPAVIDTWSGDDAEEWLNVASGFTQPHGQFKAPDRVVKLEDYGAEFDKYIDPQYDTFYRGFNPEEYKGGGYVKTYFDGGYVE